jgi:succinyl-diaminopimelate desuccinylase
MDNVRDFIVTLTKEIVKERTVNYNPADFPAGAGPDGMTMPGEEIKVAAILERYLKDAKIPFTSHGKDPKRPNLLATVGQNKPGFKKFLVVLHTDTVPSGVREDWSFDPFEPFEKNGKLFGRGVLDNKGPLAASFVTLRMMKEIEKEIHGQFIYAACADEEVEAGFGLDWLLEQNLIQCTDALIPDIAGCMKTINIAEKGRSLAKVRFKGVAAHAMDPSKGVSAIYAAARFLKALQEGFQFTFTPHPVLDPPTFNPGLIKGGEAPNAVPAGCEVSIDVRLLPGMTQEGVQRELLALAESAKLPGSSVTVEVTGTIPPSEVPDTAPIVKLIREVAPGAATIGTGGITFAKFLVLKGIQAVGWAPGDERTYHKPDEEIDIDELVEFSGRLFTLSKKICNLPA